MKRIHADRYSTTEYVTTREIVGLTKERYYRILGLSRVVVSFAMQENYGTAMNEAAALGCWNVAPNWKCYPETVVARGVGSLFPCWDVEEAARLVEHYLSAKESAPWDGYYEHTEERAYAIMQDITERASHES
jgi:glycosyltransferase involved in cell wall biosynthesis